MISQPHVYQGLQLLSDLRNILQNRQRIRDRHFQQVGDGVSFVLHRQGFMVIALAAADFAKHIDIGQEIHFNPPLSFALAGLAAAAGDIE